jgi:hypothetical protein
MKRPQRIYPISFKTRGPTDVFTKAENQLENSRRLFHMRLDVTGMTRRELAELLVLEANKLVFYAEEDENLGLPHKYVETHRNKTLFNQFGEDVGRIWCVDEDRTGIGSNTFYRKLSTREKGK